MLIRDVRFGRTNAWAPQKAAWKGDEFLFGEIRHDATTATVNISSLTLLQDVNEAVDSGNIKETEVVELWKLLLYKDLSTAKIAKEADKTLGDRWVDDLLEVHLRAVKQAAIANIKQMAGLDFSVRELEEADIQLFLSVPQVC